MHLPTLLFALALSLSPSLGAPTPEAFLDCNSEEITFLRPRYRTIQGIRNQYSNSQQRTENTAGAGPKCVIDLSRRDGPVSVLTADEAGLYDEPERGSVEGVPVEVGASSGPLQQTVSHSSEDRWTWCSRPLDAAGDSDEQQDDLRLGLPPASPSPYTPGLSSSHACIPAIELKSGLAMIAAKLQLLRLRRFVSPNAEGRTHSLAAAVSRENMELVIAGALVVVLVLLVLAGVETVAGLWRRDVGRAMRRRVRRLRERKVAVEEFNEKALYVRISAPEASPIPAVQGDGEK